MEIKKPNLYRYQNYREFLRDLYQFKKQHSTHSFSFRIFSERARLGSPNYFKLVMEGSRNLSPKMISRFAEALKLENRQKEFFDTLVHFNQAKGNSEKETYFHRLMSFREHRAATKIALGQLDYLSHWYYVAIREMVELKGFNADPKRVATQLFPPITTAQAKETIRTLLKLGLLIKNKRGELKQSDPHLATDETVSALSAYHFHRQMIQQGLAALNQANQEREIASITLALPKSELVKMKKKLHQFLNEVQQWLETISTKPEEIYQLNFQLFPLTKMNKETL